MPAPETGSGKIDDDRQDVELPFFDELFQQALSIATGQSTNFHIFHKSMSLEQIMAALPHRKPMLLVDQILEQSDSHIVCEKTFDADEYFFQGHYPDFPLVPGVILCECAVQAGAILLAEKTSGQSGVPVLTRLNDVRFKRMVKPGESIRSEIKLDEVVSTAFYLSAKVTCEEKKRRSIQFCLQPCPDRIKRVAISPCDFSRVHA